MTDGVSLNNLNVVYSDKRVLQELTANLGASRLTALIGPNGSGKSTLLRAMAGLIPYEGSLTLGDREIRRWTRRELGRKVGFLPQNGSVTFPFVACDLIDLGRLPRRRAFQIRRGRDDGATVRAARAVGVEPLLFRSMKELSGGESQRVMIAMLLNQDPDLFFLDEPTSSLDPGQAVAVLSLFRRLTQRGKTVVVAAHDINGVLTWADSVMALKKGRLLFHGAPADLTGANLEGIYDTPFTAYRSEKGETLWHASSP